MLLHKLGREINEDNITKVLKAVDVEVDAAKVKSLVAALEGVNIEEVVKNSDITAAAPQTQEVGASSDSSPSSKSEEKKEKSAPKVDASAGLGSLF